MLPWPKNNGHLYYAKKRTLFLIMQYHEIATVARLAANSRILGLAPKLDFLYAKI